jgi:hypothetical protein
MLLFQSMPLNEVEVDIFYPTIVSEIEKKEVPYVRNYCYWW